jgi:hypothetical protein
VPPHQLEPERTGNNEPPTAWAYDGLSSGLLRPTFLTITRTDTLKADPRSLSHQGERVFDIRGVQAMAPRVQQG